MSVPSSELGSSTPSPASKYVPPITKGLKGGGGHTLLWVTGWESSNKDDWRISLVQSANRKSTNSWAYSPITNLKKCAD